MVDIAGSGSLFRPHRRCPTRLQRNARAARRACVGAAARLGLYPPGAWVKLQCGEIAMVLRRSPGAKTPVVVSVMSRTGMPPCRVACVKYSLIDSTGSPATWLDRCRRPESGALRVQQ
jgi:hypothetical protein